MRMQCKCGEILSNSSGHFIYSFQILFKTPFFVSFIIKFIHSSQEQMREHEVELYNRPFGKTQWIF